MTENTQIFAMFPGQGSQKTGMGKDLYDSFDIAKKLFTTASEILGLDLARLCFEGPQEELTQTEISQPAILTVSTICYEIYKEKNGGVLDVIAGAGHSLGEYSALVAAGSIKFEDAVIQVHKRGKYMQKAVPAGVGKMLAVLGVEIEIIEETISKIDDIVQIANINAIGQVVISGNATAIDKFKELMPNSKLIELPVSAPFHCSLMKPAADQLAQDLDSLEIKDATFPIIANVTASPIQKTNDIRQALKDQVCGTVRWVETIQHAATKIKPNIFLEFGYGNVLTGLIKRIDKSLNRETVNSF